MIAMEKYTHAPETQARTDTGGRTNTKRLADTHQANRFRLWYAEERAMPPLIDRAPDVVLAVIRQKGLQLREQTVWGGRRQAHRQQRRDQVSDVDEAEVAQVPHGGGSRDIALHAMTK